MPSANHSARVAASEARLASPAGGEARYRGRMARIPAAGDVAAGVALIAIPWLTAVLKFVAAGWFLLFYAMGLLLFVPLYVLVIVIAVTGFFGPRPAFAFAGSGRLRGRIAAWLHPVAFLLATAVLVDGGDDGSWTNPLAVLLGMPSNSAFADVTTTAFVPLCLVSAGALVWLFVEWIRALRARSATGSGDARPRGA